MPAEEQSLNAVQLQSGMHSVGRHSGSVQDGVSGVQLWCSAGLPTTVLQACVSMQLLVCCPSAEQSVNCVQSQLAAQAQLWVSDGLLADLLQPVGSLQYIGCCPFEHWPYVQVHEDSHDGE
jgi:hypothetical protein